MLDKVHIPVNNFHLPPSLIFRYLILLNSHEKLWHKHNLLCTSFHLITWIFPLNITTFILYYIPFIYIWKTSLNITTFILDYISFIYIWQTSLNITNFILSFVYSFFFLKITSKYNSLHIIFFHLYFKTIYL